METQSQRRGMQPCDAMWALGLCGTGLYASLSSVAACHRVEAPQRQRLDGNGHCAFAELPVQLRAREPYSSVGGSGWSVEVDRARS